MVLKYKNQKLNLLNCLSENKNLHTYINIAYISYYYTNRTVIFTFLNINAIYNINIGLATCQSNISEKHLKISWLRLPNYRYRLL